jgi:CBS domain-containing protein
METTLHEILEAKGDTTVYKATPNESVLEAVDAMCLEHVGALMVVDGERPVGIFSERDLMKRVVLERRDPQTTKVGDVMTKEVVCIGVDSSPSEAMRIMTEKRCRHLPVVVDGKLVGIVSIGDLVRWVSRNQEYEIRMLHEYLEGRYPG